MLQLDAPLAQSIVDRAMAIIHSNVNVMNHRGFIIASGDPARIGAQHEGALLVLAQGRTVEIDADLARRLHDARPGINLPLHAEGAIVGVVGLSGEPDQIRQYAELLQMAAETMLEQARLMQLLARDARLREELVLQLIGAGEANMPALDDWARRIGVDLGLTRIAVVIEIDSRDVDAILSEQQRLQALLGSLDGRNLVASAKLGELVLLMPASDARGVWSLPMQRKHIHALHARLGEASAVRIRLALGGYFPGPLGLLRSYRSALTSLQVGRQRQSQLAVHCYADLTLPVLLAGLGEGWQADELRRPLERLGEHDRRGQLRDTLSAWFAHDMKVAATANALNLHRNTLDYRLGRIAAATGLDLGRLDDCLLLYIGLQLHVSVDEIE
ncbi:MAG: helix-turn-helix domain-containing protein [Zoogloeaceae bacterium]|nr:helix-turn-helix domain-containing protein [Zoogloeaceae bacterium]